MPAPSHLAELENSAHRIVGFLWGRTGQTYLAVPRHGGETITIRVSILLIAARILLSRRHLFSLTAATQSHGTPPLVLMQRRHPCL